MPLTVTLRSEEPKIPALYTHTTRSSGTVLTATIYNGDHQNHIDNGVPLQHDDYSINTVQMQTITDPGEVGTESLATTQAGEFERLRFAIKEIRGSAQWYSTVGTKNTPVAKSATFNITNADKNVIFDATGTYSVTFNALSTFDADFTVTVINTGTGIVTLDPNASELIEGPGTTDSGDLTYPLPYGSSAVGPYNISGVTLYKKSATVWGILSVREAHGKQVFTTSGTWTAPEGVKTVWLTASGAGGGGGGIAASTFSGAGGGGGGNISISAVAAVVPGTAYTVTIGTGGAGGTGGANGSTGGTTSIGALLSLTGGTGGGLGPANSVGGGGDGGGQGGDGILADTNGGLKQFATGGYGGVNRLSGSTKGNATINGVASGNNGKLYGSGGSGATSGNGAGAAVNGGTGADGIAIIEW